MMKLFQIVVFTAVMFGNIHWQWIKNGYAATLGAAIFTYYVTVLLVKAIEAGYLGPRARLRLVQRATRLGLDSAARS